MDPHPSFTRRAPAKQAEEGLPLFDAPDVRTPAPAAPGSETSQDAADIVTASPFRRRTHRAILLALRDRGPLTREALSAATGLKESSLCARLSELCPIWVECREGAGTSRAKMRVNVYALTAATREKMTREIAP